MLDVIFKTGATVHGWLHNSFLEGCWGDCEQTRLRTRDFKCFANVLTVSMNFISRIVSSRPCLTLRLFRLVSTGNPEERERQFGSSSILAAPPPAVQSSAQGSRPRSLARGRHLAGSHRDAPALKPTLLSCPAASFCSFCFLMSPTPPPPKVAILQTAWHGR